MTSPTVKALLRLHNLIKEPEHWTKYTDAADSNGNNVSINSNKATCFCLVGAVKRISRSTEIQKRLYNILAKEIKPESRRYPSDVVIGWNDHDDRTHADVVNLLNKVIGNQERKVT